MNTRLILSLVVIVVLLTSVGGATAHSGTPAPAAPQAAVGTGFTFQGQLKNAGATVNGSCAMTFRLYDAAATGMQIGSTITATVPVSNSLFTVMLNTNGEYGANAFNGDARWLQVAVKCAGDATFTTLSPRQPITAAPYAQYSLIGSNASLTPYVPLHRPQVLDLKAVDPNLAGYTGGFTDGRYAYFVPNYNGTTAQQHGKLVRVDLNDYSVSGVTTMDLTMVDSTLKGFFGGFTDGRYGYLVPNNNSSSGKIARIDLQSFITSTVTVLDLAAVDTGLKGFTGGFTDGHYGYFVPYQNGGTYHGKVARVDLQNFAAGGVTVLDLATVDTTLKGFVGGFTDGRYAYFVPYRNPAFFGKLARVDLLNFTISGVTLLDLAAVDSSFVGFAGGFTDGRYGYLVPEKISDTVYHGRVVRVDLQNFSLGDVTSLDLANVDLGLKGFDGGFTDGHYAYLVPHQISVAEYSGKLARVDLMNFSAGGVEWLDFAAQDSNLKGFYGGFTDGRYGYLVPYFDGASSSGKIARIQFFSGTGTP